MTRRETDDRPFEDTGHGLTDEISDVIEEHGRGLDADGISSAIESVLADYDEPDEPSAMSNAKLERELRRFVDRYRGKFDRDDILETLRIVAEDLRASSLEPDVEVDRGEPVSVVTLGFDCAFALEQAMPQLFDIRGYFVQADAALTYLDEIYVRVAALPIEESVELDACVTRTAPNGFTVQVWQPARTVERQLRSLPDDMREERF